MNRLNAEQRLLSFFIMLSWLAFSFVKLYDVGSSEQRQNELKDAMVPSFLEFLSSYPVDVKLNIAEVVEEGTVSRVVFKKRNPNGFREEIEQQPSRWYDLNQVDSVFLESLPWIGPHLAGRICRYRNLLGGFYAVDQLDEVWGIHPDQVRTIRPWFHVGEGVNRKLCVESTSWDDLRRHPYIGFDGARMIERFRRHHKLDSVSDLLEAIPITDSLYRSWEPYLRVCKAEGLLN